MMGNCSATMRSTSVILPVLLVWLRSATSPLTALPYSDSTVLLLLDDGRNSHQQIWMPAGGLMSYSYTQISHYLTCPRRYRHRYLDGWKEKDMRAAMLFGRAFELALGAYFHGEDPGEVLFREWSASKNQELQFSNHDSWDRMLEQGIMLLIRFC